VTVRPYHKPPAPTAAKREKKKMGSSMCGGTLGGRFHFKEGGKSQQRKWGEGDLLFFVTRAGKNREDAALPAGTRSFSNGGKGKGTLGTWVPEGPTEHKEKGSFLWGEGTTTRTFNVGQERLDDLVELVARRGPPKKRRRRGRPVGIRKKSSVFLPQMGEKGG